MGQELLQSGYGYLLQMGYYKVGQHFCKVEQLLQKRRAHRGNTRAIGSL